jgi:hypothetical protein
MARLGIDSRLAATLVAPTTNRDVAQCNDGEAGSFDVLGGSTSGVGVGVRGGVGGGDVGVGTAGVEAGVLEGVGCFGEE